jgi:sRNA-binding protein
VPRRTVTTALHWYCDHYRYLIAMQPGAVRIDALGQPAGIVTEDEAAIAQQRLAEKLKPQFKSPQLAAPTLAA